MSYFVTGATGFIGGRLVKQLLEQRKGTIYLLTRRASKKRLDKLIKEWGGEKRLVPIIGDLAKRNLGVSKADLEKVKKAKIKHFFHLAAIYDMSADAESQKKANLDGTAHALQLAKAIKAGCFHHTSSIAAAGTYQGTFTEEMFEEATGLDHPYFSTKHDSEALVRAEKGIPWRIYRPAMVVGDSKTGEIDKVDGPYYLFTLIKKLRKSLPPWVPIAGIEGGHWNIVPVDFVVDAMNHLAHKKGLNGRCFHLTDTEDYRVGELFNMFAKTANAPRMAMRINASMFAFIPSGILSAITSLAPIRRIIDTVLGDLGIPSSALKFINYKPRFDNKATLKELKGSGIQAPNLNDYAWRIWDYWERHLDPSLFVDRTLSGRVRNKVVLVTGASSGIGQSVALKVAEAGANVIIVARGKEKLLETEKMIKKAGGKAFMYTADLSDLKSCDRLVKNVTKDHGGVDVLVNNAGRSIRRSVALSYDRFHDFERTMQLNYFGCLRLTLGFLPGMQEKRNGHIINISSIGAQSYPSRFSAYVASKSALDAFSQCASSEFSSENIHFTTINMPLVRTPMIAPTKLYNNVPTISPDEAAAMITKAIVYRPKRVATRLGTFMAVSHALMPKVTEIILNTAYKLFPDSAAAKGEKEKEQEVSAEQIAFAQITRGIHW